MITQKVVVASMQIPDQMGFGRRVETGPVEFTYPNGITDWPAVVIRGDNAEGYAFILKQVLDNLPDPLPQEWPHELELRALRGLLSDLSGCVLGPRPCWRDAEGTEVAIQMA